jgi:RNA polymerase sigma-70 factor (ECF subfamily)
MAQRGRWPQLILHDAAAPSPTPGASVLSLGVPSAAATDPARESADFVKLLSLHLDQAYRFAYRLAGNAHDAEDCVQQAAEEAFRAFHRFRPGTRFDRWFMRILYNSFVDEIRRRKRHPTVSAESLLPDALTADARSDPEIVAQGALEGRVQQAIKALPIEFRAPVVLVDLMEMSYEEAAEAIRCPVGTIRSRLHRGRLALRRSLGPRVDPKKEEPPSPSVP